ncbi:MAG: HPr family phosphocarrier protein [Pseudomonadota bacterium]|nr:HPr family phosphocarrier protein [Pseudomonadota bacterium]
MPRNEQGSPPGPAGEGHYFAEVVVRNRKGLHARASAMFVKCAESWDADISVTREGQTVPGTSIMGLMMLAAGRGNTILIETEGPQAREALDALIALVEAGFNETE